MLKVQLELWNATTDLLEMFQFWNISHFPCGMVQLHTNYYCPNWREAQAFPRGQVVVPQESVTTETTEQRFQNFSANELWEVKIHRFSVEAVILNKGVVTETVVLPMEYTEKVTKISQKMADWCKEALEKPMLCQTGENTYSYL